MGRLRILARRTRGLTAMLADRLLRKGHPEGLTLMKELTLEAQADLQVKKVIIHGATRVGPEGEPEDERVGLEVKLKNVGERPFTATSAELPDMDRAATSGRGWRRRTAA